LIDKTSSIYLYVKLKALASWIFQLLLHMVFTSRNWFAMQGPVAIILISWNVIFIWETGYWTRAIKRFALFDLLKSLYSDTRLS
jgi:ABC-type proline/glycine betaine transport system permease subunit